VKLIKRKKNDKSFVSAYWSLAHQKMLEECLPIESGHTENKLSKTAKMNQSFNGMEEFGEI
jgi:hypothetical protein